MKKTAGIYDPYLDTLGGGERYCLTVVEILLSLGYDVDIFWSGNQGLLTKAETRFNLKLANARFVPDIFRVEPHTIDEVGDPENIIKVSSHLHQPPTRLTRINQFINKVKVTRKYDLFFYLSDWSVPFLFSKNNLLHVQVPFIIKPTLKSKILNYSKSIFFNKIICNSQFTAKFASSYFGAKCQVIYPPVDVAKFDPSSAKLNLILSVGRFDNILNSKKQEIMLDAFKSIYHHQKNTSWKLILAGGSLAAPEKNSFLQHLRRLAAGLPVSFVVNPNFTELKTLYSRSKIYWHAAGFGVDESVHPESTEHFGMAPVEAMASGCVPILVNKGGLSEIITDGIDGYLWNDESELISQTQLLMADPALLSENSRAAVIKSRLFSKEKFAVNLQSLIKKI